LRLSGWLRSRVFLDAMNFDRGDIPQEAFIAAVKMDAD
jgi:hypothetical protein